MTGQIFYPTTTGANLVGVWVHNFSSQTCICTRNIRWFWTETLYTDRIHTPVTGHLIKECSLIQAVSPQWLGEIFQMLDSRSLGKIQIPGPQKSGEYPDPWIPGVWGRGIILVLDSCNNSCTWMPKLLPALPLHWAQTPEESSKSELESEPLHQENQQDLPEYGTSMK